MDKVKKIIIVSMALVTLMFNVTKRTVYADTEETVKYVWETATDAEFWKQLFGLCTNVIGYSIQLDTDEVETTVENFKDYMNGKGLIRDGILQLNEDGSVTVPDSVMDLAYEYIKKNLQSKDGMIYVPPEINTSFWNSGYFSVMPVGYLTLDGYNAFLEYYNNALYDAYSLLYHDNYGTPSYYYYAMDIDIPADEVYILTCNGFDKSEINDYILNGNQSSSIYCILRSMKYDLATKKYTYTKNFNSVSYWYANRGEPGEWYGYVPEYGVTTYEFIKIGYGSSPNDFWRLKKGIKAFDSEQSYINYINGKGSGFATTNYINYNISNDNSVTYNYDIVNETNWYNTYETNIYNMQTYVTNVYNVDASVTSNTYTEIADIYWQDTQELLNGIEENTKVSNGFLNQINTKLKNLGSMIEAFQKKIIAFLEADKSELLDAYWEQAKEWSITLANEWKKNIETLITNIIDKLEEVKVAIVEAIGSIPGGSIIDNDSDKEKSQDGILTWIKSLLGDAIGALIEMVFKAITAVIGSCLDLVTYIIEDLIGGIGTTISNLVDALTFKGDLSGGNQYFTFISSMINILPTDILTAFLIGFIGLAITMLLKYLT